MFRNGKGTQGGNWAANGSSRTTPKLSWSSGARSAHGPELRQHRARAASESHSWDWMEQCPHPSRVFQQNQAVLGHPHPPQIPLLLTLKLWQSLPRHQQPEQQWAEARTTGNLSGSREDRKQNTRSYFPLSLPDSPLFPRSDGYSSPSGALCDHVPVMGVPGSWAGVGSKAGRSPEPDFPPGGGGSKLRPPGPAGRGLVFPVAPSFFFMF